MLVTCRASVCAVSQDAVTIRRTLILNVSIFACFRAALEHKLYFNIPIYKRRLGLIPLVRRPEREADDAPPPSTKTKLREGRVMAQAVCRRPLKVGPFSVPGGSVWGNYNELALGQVCLQGP